MADAKSAGDRDFDAQQKGDSRDSKSTAKAAAEENDAADGKEDYDGFYQTAARSGAKNSGPYNEKRLTDDEILEQLQKYFYEDPTLSKSLEQFVENNCAIMDLETDEYQLQYTEVHREFKALFERLLETFIEQQMHINIKDVFAAMSRKIEENEQSMEAFFAQVLLATADFEVFISMMGDMKKQRSHK